VVNCPGNIQSPARGGATPRLSSAPDVRVVVKPLLKNQEAGGGGTIVVVPRFVDLAPKRADRLLKVSC
jgi:hypothetical protein